MDPILKNPQGLRQADRFPKEKQGFRRKFEEILERFRTLGGDSLKHDYQVGEILGFKPKAFYARRDRVSIPEKEIRLWCQENGIREDYLLRGEGPPFSQKSSSLPIIENWSKELNAIVAKVNADLEKLKEKQVQQDEAYLKDLTRTSSHTGKSIKNFESDFNFKARDFKFIHPAFHAALDLYTYLANDKRLIGMADPNFLPKLSALMRKIERV